MAEESTAAMQQASHYAEPRGDMLEVWCPELDEEVGILLGDCVNYCPMCGDAL